MNENKITTVVEEAARLLRENPSWTYRKAMAKAKELILDESLENVAETN